MGIVIHQLGEVIKLKKNSENYLWTYTLWGINYHWTLSKILCKWKLDSVVSFFLYLNSVFKKTNKLIHDQVPV